MVDYPELPRRDGPGNNGRRLEDREDHRLTHYPSFAAGRRFFRGGGGRHYDWIRHVCKRFLLHHARNRRRGVRRWSHARLACGAMDLGKKDCYRMDCYVPRSSVDRRSRVCLCPLRDSAVYSLKSQRKKRRFWCSWILHELAKSCPYSGSCFTLAALA